MASASRESGGIGGKFPKRPLRRPAPTPYDRPPAVARGSGLRPLAPEARGSGWFSRLVVDPASRMISSGASMFFSSVFRKRLTAPPEAPVESPQPSQKAAATDNATSLPEVPEQRERGIESTTKTSDSDGISELEQLVKQKTFTRLEFERLTELLRSRTVESDMKEAAVDDAFQEASFSLGKEKSDMPSGSAAIPSGTIMIPEQTIASPSEIAKAYMGSRPSKLPASTLRSGNQVFHQEAVVAGNQFHRTKASDTPIPPRSIENPDNSFFTSKPRGRSAIYKMARSPYFKLQPTTNMTGDVFSRNGFAGTSTPTQRTADATNPPSSKQILKRGRSLLDNDLGYFSSIRRTRQKPDVASPLKDEHVPSSSIFGQKLLQSHVSERGALDFDAYNGDNRKSDEPDLHIPVQSSAMARKILQQLDKLVPSPKEKPSEPKRIATDEPSPKLTQNMLHERALTSMKDINATKFVGTQGNLDVDIVGSSHQSFPQKRDKAQDNGPSKLALFEAKTSVSDRFLSAARSSVHGMPHNTVLELTPSIPVKVSQQGKPAFIISAPEDDTLELDDDYGRKSTLSSPGKIKPDPNFLGSKVALEKPLVSSSVSLPAPFISVRGSNEKASEKPAGILSTVVAPASLAPEPPVPIRHLDKSSQGQERSPLFASGLKESQPSILSAISSDAAAAATANNTGAKLNSEPGLPNRNSVAASTPSSDLDKVAKPEKSEESLKEFSNSKSLPVLSFGASNSGLSNGSLNSKQPSFLFSEVSKNSDSTVISENNASLSSSFGFSKSSPPAVFSVLPKLQFGAVGSTNSSLTQDDNKPAPESTVKNPVNESFSFASTNSIGAFNLVNSSSSNLATSAFASSGGNSNIFSGTTGGSSAITSFSGTVGSLTTASAPSFSSTSGDSFRSSSLAQCGSSISSSAASSPSFVAATKSSVSGMPAALSSSGISNASQCTGPQNLFSSTPSFGLAASSSNGLGNSSFGSVAPSGIPFGSGSGFSFSAGTTGSSAGASSSSASPASNVLGATSQAALPSGLGSASSLSVAVFGKPATSASSSAFTFGSSAPSFSSQPSFGIATPVGSSSSGSGLFSFSASQPSFGIAAPAAGFGSGSPANDQMNVEDSMTDDAQAANPSFPQIGQQASPATPSFVFGSSNSTAPSGTPPFQFSGNQSSPAPQNLNNPFQSSGGGSFSLGSGGVDKTNRRTVKVRRDNKLRKK